jgi:hypothetical protein
MTSKGEKENTGFNVLLSELHIVLCRKPIRCTIYSYQELRDSTCLWALFTHPQEGTHEQHLVYCMRAMSVGFPCFSQLTTHTQYTKWCLYSTSWGWASNARNILLTYSVKHSPPWQADQFSQLTNKFPAFYGTRRFFTVLTSARHLSLCRANSIQSPRPLPPSWTSILTLNLSTMTTVVQPFNVIEWQLKFNPVA